MFYNTLVNGTYYEARGYGEKTKKQGKLEFLVYCKEDSLGARVNLPITYVIAILKWLLAITIAISMKFLPEWWDLIKAVL